MLKLAARFQQLWPPFVSSIPFAISNRSNGIQAFSSVLLCDPLRLGDLDYRNRNNNELFLFIQLDAKNINESVHYLMIISTFCLATDS